MSTATASPPAPDTIFIRELRHQTLVGVYPWEREATQAVELDIEFCREFAGLNQSDPAPRANEVVSDRYC
jgi:dihydroneopterin aldolase